MTTIEATTPEGSERRRWPIVKSNVEMPASIVRKCAEPSLEWHASEILRFERDGTPASRPNLDVRQSESMLLSETRNADLWFWLRDRAIRGLKLWTRAHPDYIPGPLRPQCGQLIRYAKGHFFSAHSDFSFYPRLDQYRVLMALIGVSRAQDYVGGEIVFETCPARFKLDRGDMLIYPAALLHEVEEVSRGERVTMLAELRAPLSQGQLQRYVDQFQHEPEQVD